MITPPQMIVPLLSIIIPLEFHRGQWDRAWQGWQSQTLDRDSFEIMLVVPPDFPDRDKLAAGDIGARALGFSRDLWGRSRTGRSRRRHGLCIS